ncbi:MAG: hypothetical protein J6J33_05170 [Clostridia bacterium]|nr:hypothetical protein [Clostridia bacterium]
MDGLVKLKEIFKGILVDLNYTEEQIKSITDLVRSPEEMVKIVNAIEQNPGIDYNSLFEIVLNSIEFDIVIDN